MSRYWSQLTHELSPYVPGEQPQAQGMVKLNTNESPFSPSPQAIHAVQCAAAESLRLYPDPSATQLRAELARYHGLAPEQVFVGNGSDEVLAHAFAALLKQSRALLFPDVTYSFYPTYCKLFGIDFQIVPLNERMGIEISDYSGRGGAVIIANPNAPTGIALPREAVERLALECNGGPVIVDEAYVDFGAETAVPLIRRHPNLLIVQTMSKSRALAGLRVGYALGHADLITALTRVKDSFNSYPLGRPALAGAIASLKDEEYFQRTCAAIIQNRAVLTATLVGLGFDVLPSSANFVLARHAQYSGQALTTALRRQGVLVRHFDQPRLSDFLRITVGSEQDIARLSDALTLILPSGPGE